MGGKENKRAAISKIFVIIIPYLVFVVVFYLFSDKIKLLLDFIIFRRLFGVNIKEHLPLVSSGLVAFFAILLPSIIIYLFKYVLQLKKVSDTLIVNIISKEVTTEFEEYLSYIPKPKTSLLPDIRARGIPYRVLSIVYYVVSSLPVLDKNYFVTCMLISFPFIIYQLKGIVKKEHRQVDLNLKLVVLISFLAIFSVSFYNTISDIWNKSFKSKALSGFICMLPDALEKLSIRIDREHFYDIAIFLYPQNGDCYIKRGLMYEESNILEKAENSYHMAIAGQPDNFEAYYRLAGIYTKKGQDEKALDMLYKALGLNKNFASAYYETANIYYKKGYADKADELLAKSISINEDDYKNYHLKGSILFKKGNFLDALSAYSQAIELEQGISDIYFDKSHVQFRLSSLDGALFNINKAVELDAQNPQYLYLKGIILLSLNMLNESKECFKSALAVKPDFILTKAALSLVDLKEGKLKKAKMDITAAVPESCQISEALFIKSYVLKETQNYEEAHKAIDKAILISPGTAEYYSLKAAIMLDSGNKNEVLEYLNIAIKINKMDYYAYFVKGNFLLQNNDYKNASINLDMSIDHNPYFARAYAAKAFAEQKLKNETLSDDYMDMAIKIDSKDYYNYLIKSNIYSIRGKLIAAEAARNKAAKLYE